MAPLERRLGSDDINVPYLLIYRHLRLPIHHSPGEARPRDPGGLRKSGAGEKVVDSRAASAGAHFWRPTCTVPARGSGTGAGGGTLNICVLHLHRHDIIVTRISRAIAVHLVDLRSISLTARGPDPRPDRDHHHGRLDRSAGDRRSRPPHPRLRPATAGDCAPSA
jgi:hypothetical protein